MSAKGRATSGTFKLAPSMRFDDAKRNLRQLVIRLSEQGGEVTICKTEDKPQFIICSYDRAKKRGEDLSNAQSVSVAQFAAKSISWQTILRYEGEPIILELSSGEKAVIKVHPDWRSETIEQARQRFLAGRREEVPATISAKLDDILRILNKNAKPK